VKPTATNTISQSIGGTGFQPVQRRLKPAATNNCLLIATQYNTWLGFGILSLGLALCLAGCAPKYYPPPPPPPPPHTVAPPPPVARPVFYIKANHLNLRACPGMDCPKISVLEKGEEVEKVGEAEDWFQIRVKRDGRLGWVDSRYLSSNPVTPAPEVVPAPPEVVTPPPLPERLQPPPLPQPVQPPLPEKPVPPAKAPAAEKPKPAKPAEEAAPPAKKKPEEAKPAKPAKPKPGEEAAPAPRKPAVEKPAKEEKPTPKEEKPAPPPEPESGKKIRIM